MAARDRIEGVDVARGLASLIMIQGHAYDGWASPEAKTTGAYLFTRFLGSLPLPAFLVLAGAAVVLRVDAAARRAERAVDARASVMKRGLSVVLFGYGSSAVYALMDGYDSLDTILRADVLQLIGLSIVLLAALGIRGASPEAPPSLRRLAVVAGLLTVVPVALCPWLAPLGQHAPGWLRPVVALVVDVPGLTRMPMVPLTGWLGLGSLVALLMLRARARSETPSPAGASDRWLVGLLGLSALGAWLANVAMHGMLAALGGPLSRAHPAVWANALDLGLRGVAVLAVGALVSQRLPQPAKRAMLRLGRGSLYAYVFHIPFCYGALGAPLRGRLDMVTATGAVLVLMALSWGAVRARDAIREWRTSSSDRWQRS